MQGEEDFGWTVFVIAVIALIVYFVFFKKPSNASPSTTSDTSTSANTLTISNPLGAVVFIQATDGMHSTTQTVAYNTKLTYTNIVNASDCSTQVCNLPSDFYQTPSGFLSKKDITILLTR